MTTYEITCSNCTNPLELAEPALEATIKHGCPLCGSSLERSE